MHFGLHLMNPEPCYSQASPRSLESWQDKDIHSFNQACFLALKYRGEIRIEYYNGERDTLRMLLTQLAPAP